MREQSYTLVRSRRKTLAIVVDSGGNLIVRAPMRMSMTTIDAFIGKKAAWIADKQRQALDCRAQHDAVTLENGSRVLLFGKPHDVARREVREVAVEDDLLIVPTDMRIDAFAGWMKAQAEGFIRERASTLAAQMRVQYTSVKLSGARRRWGSCGARNTLNFAWRLVMCPPFVIDYVVVHELAHIVHNNHGKDFWSLVAAVMPGYAEANRWLKHNSWLLDVI